MTVVVPSRGRPQNMARLLGDWAETMTADSYLHIVVDHDDPELAGYQALQIPEFAELTIQNQRGLNRILNTIAVNDAELAPIVGFMGDDHAPRTLGWDKQIVDALMWRKGVAYGDDLLMSEKLPTASFISSEIIRCLGWFSPPSLTHLCLDVFWLELGRNTNLHYLSGVVIEHLHPAAGKAEFDERYAAVNSPEIVKRDAEAWYVYRDNDWPADWAKLKAAGLSG